VGFGDGKAGSAAISHVSGMLTEDAVVPRECEDLCNSEYMAVDLGLSACICV
jgi:hypothetical protein